MQYTSRRMALCASAVLAIGWAHTVHATVIQTPAVLVPGDQFRIIFVTVGARNATSTAIDDYDSFVNTDSGSVTYNGQLVNFLVIGSTATVDAIDHIGESSAPVFLNDGVSKIANSTTTAPDGLWSGTLLDGIHLDVTGAASPSASIWTGTNSSGTESFFGPTSMALGAANPRQGLSNTFFASWIDVSPFPTANSSLRRMYGISPVLTVPVPEPSSVVLFGLGAISLLVVARWRKGA